MWREREIDLSYLRVFVCTAYSHVPPKESRKKFGLRSRKLIFVVYSVESNACRLLDPEFPSKIRISRHVIILENQIYGAYFVKNTCQFERNKSAQKVEQEKIVIKEQNKDDDSEVNEKK